MKINDVKPGEPFNLINKNRHTVTYHIHVDGRSDIRLQLLPGGQITMTCHSGDIGIDVEAIAEDGIKAVD
jgi:hypothetical protein